MLTNHTLHVYFRLRSFNDELNTLKIEIKKKKKREREQDMRAHTHTHTLYRRIFKLFMGNINGLSPGFYACLDERNMVQLGVASLEKSWNVQDEKGLPWRWKHSRPSKPQRAKLTPTRDKLCLTSGCHHIVIQVTASLPGWTKENGFWFCLPWEHRVSALE